MFENIVWHDGLYTSNGKKNEENTMIVMFIFLVFGTHYSQNFVFSCVVISIIFFIIININKSLVFGTHEMNLRCLLSKMVRVGKIKKSKSPSPSILFP